MSDSTTNIPQLDIGQGNPEARINELFDAASAAMVYGRNAATSTGRVFGYLGGRWSGFSVANGVSATLTAMTTQYMVVERATGAVTFSSSDTNWNDDTLYARAYKLTVGASTITAYEDHRAGEGGTLGAGGGGGGGGGSTVGKQSIYVAAGAMRPSVTGGCNTLTAIASASNQPDILTLDFDATTQEYAQFGIALPKKWDEGTVTFKAYWSHAATTTNFGVVWNLQAVAVGNDDAIAVAFGTAQTSTDTGGTTNDLYVSPESSAITVAGTPAAEDMVFFRLSRVTGDGGDTMAIDARLHGIMLYITTDAGTDA